MLRFAKWLGYRDKVLDHLGALLVMYPRGRQFTGDFPGLLPELKRNFEAGVSPASAALQLTAAIIGDIMGQLSEEQRASMLTRLEALRPSELQTMAARRLSRRSPEPRDPAEFAAGLIGVALFLARRMVEAGTLGHSEYAFLVFELEHALQRESRNDAAPSRGPRLSKAAELYDP